MPIRIVPLDAILGRFSPVGQTVVREMLTRPGVSGVCYFENQQMDSPQFGSGQALIFGPSCTYKTLGELDGKWLNDLPSQRQYPVEAYVIPASEGLTAPTAETPQ